MKGLRNLLLAAVAVLGLTALPAFAYGPFYADNVMTYEHGAPLTVHVDGSYVATDVQPEIVNGRTFLPMRAVAEAMDASVSWDGSKKLISVFKNGTEAYFYVGWQTYYVNGQAKTASVAPYIKDGRTMLP
ncbi:MAG: copper amine oxidase N-terminal domain-containing protein, partial [Peptococcaceae bacterium]|nr:copper amine oxidase N-terminal domain-containing protein [Peptococcaceae bacterium]